MRWHMLVQLPLLVLAGLCIGQAWRDWPQSTVLEHGQACSRARCAVRDRLRAWNHQGISGLLLASVVMVLWMLPLALDAALDQPWVTAAKFLSLPLLVGVPWALSWPSAGLLVRGVFVVELVATLFRTGWLYLASPTRLCTNYLLDAQQATGQGLLVAGSAIFLLAVARVLWRPVAGGQNQRTKTRERAMAPWHPTVPVAHDRHAGRRRPAK
ncbi:hypothetical protein [Castellaniella sp.]|uniref:hypothetical protein n=1 Tax=Castellaniella sp. TaxID=1955812 RepID=UPI00355FD24B